MHQSIRVVCLLLLVVFCLEAMSSKPPLKGPPSGSAEVRKSSVVQHKLTGTCTLAEPPHLPGPANCLTSTSNAISNLTATATPPSADCPLPATAIPPLTETLHRTMTPSVPLTPSCVAAFAHAQSSVRSTQPIQQPILKGVIAYVEVRSHREDRSKPFIQELTLLGANVVPKFTCEVTHVIYKDGTKTTRDRARKKGIHLVSVLWVDSCKKTQKHVEEELFPPEDEGTSIAGGCKKSRSMQPNDFEEEVRKSGERLKKRHKRQENLNLNVMELPSSLSVTETDSISPIHAMPCDHTYSYQRAEAGTPTHQRAEPGTPTHQRAKPDQSTHQTAEPGMPTHQRAKPDQSTHQTAGPGTPTHQHAKPAQSTPQRAEPGTPTQQHAEPGTPTQQCAEPGTPTHQTAEPGTPTHQHAKPAQSTPQRAEPGTPTQQHAKPGTPTQQRAEPGTPTQQRAEPGTPTQQHAEPGTPTQQRAEPGTPTHQTAEPGTPTHQHAKPAQSTPQRAEPGTPTQQHAKPGTPTQQRAEPGTPTQQRAEPGTPTQQRAEPGTPTKQRAEPGTPTHQTAEPGTPTHQHAKPAQSTPQRAEPGTPTQQHAKPGTPTQQRAEPGTPTHQTAEPGTPTHQTAEAGTPTHQHAKPAQSTQHRSEPEFKSAIQPGEVTYVHTLAELEDCIEEFEVENDLQFIRHVSRADFGQATIADVRNKCLKQKRSIYWCDPQPSSNTLIPQSRQPFVIMEEPLQLKCVYGPDKHAKDKRDRDQVKAGERYLHEQRLKEERAKCPQAPFKKRPFNKKKPDKRQSRKEKKQADKAKRKAAKEKLPHRDSDRRTKKAGCEASITVRHVICFPEIDIPFKDVSNRKKQSAALKERLNQGKDVEWQQRFYFRFPTLQEHNEHIKGPLAGRAHTMAPAIKQRIIEMCTNGMPDVTTIQKAIEFFVVNELFKGRTPPSKTNRRYWPKERDIYNQCYTATRRLRTTDKDLDHLKEDLDSWVKEDGERKYLLKYAHKPTQCTEDAIDDEDVKFLLVLQTPEQRRLLRRYGNDVILMDATHKTTRYHLPLFFIAVPTNGPYMVVASFIPTDESADSIIEAIEQIKEWNDDFQWEPRDVITDNDSAEIEAIKICFPGASHRLCEFHRKKSWDRWMCRGENKIPKAHHTDLQELMENVASAPTHAHVEAAKEKFRQSNLCTNALFTYFEVHWYSKKEMWCVAYANDYQKFVNTTNGVERQNRLLKYKYLKNKVAHSNISNLVRTLLDEMFPARLQKYIDMNLEAMSIFKPYPTTLDQFLHNRPEYFREHLKEKMKFADRMLQSENFPRPEIDDNGLGMVRSESNPRDDHFLFFGNQDTHPSCTCRDWQKYRMPCKHFCCIFKTVDEESVLSFKQHRPNPWTRSTNVTNMSVGINEMRKPNSKKRKQKLIPPTRITSQATMAVDAMKRLTDFVYTTPNADHISMLSKIVQAAEAEFLPTLPCANGLPLEPSPKRRRLDEDIRRESMSIDGTTYHGLQNGDNRCFAISVLQCLRACSELKEQLSLDHETQCAEHCLSCDLKEFLHNESNSADRIMQHMHEIWPEYTPNSQQCAAEYMMRMAEKIRGTHGEYPMKKVFSSNYRSAVKCGRADCGAEGRKRIIPYVCCSVPRMDVISSGINHTLAQSNVPKYRCTSCQHVSEGTKDTERTNAPPCVIIHINRAKEDGSKDYQKMEFGQDMLIPYFTGFCPYTLFATVNHIGTSAGVGHFVANVKRGDTWLHCDDRYISKTTLHRVEQSNKTGYLLFFRKGRNVASQMAREPCNDSGEKGAGPTGKQTDRLEPTDSNEAKDKIMSHWSSLSQAEIITMGDKVIHPFHQRVDAMHALSVLRLVGDEFSEELEQKADQFGMEISNKEDCTSISVFNGAVFIVQLLSKLVVSGDIVLAVSPEQESE